MGGYIWLLTYRSAMFLWLPLWVGGGCVSSWLLSDPEEPVKFCPQVGRETCLLWSDIVFFFGGVG